MSFDPRLAYLVLVFAAVFAACQAVSGLAQQATAKRKVNRRLVLAERTGSLEALVVELRKRQGQNAKGERLGAPDWVHELFRGSGVAFEPKRWATIALGLALLAGLGVLMLTKSPLLAAPAAPLAGLGLPFAFLKYKVAARTKALGRQLPEALEVVVRSLEAGHPVPTAISLVGREMSDPIGTEFGMAADEIAYGATLEQAVGRMAERAKQPDIDLFAATVRLQEKAGGDLVGLLRMSAKAVRERQKMRLKIKAASSEGRASAIILTSAPFGVLAILQVASPDFYGDVIHAKPVQYALGGLGVWMFIGNMVMRRMIDMRI